MARSVSVGDVFARLTVVEVGLRLTPNSAQARRGHSGARAVQCRCDCGTVKLMRLNDLFNGSSKSCGCLRNETTRKRNIAAWSDPEYADVQRAVLRSNSDALRSDPEYVERTKARLKEWNRERPGHRLSLHPLYTKHRNILHRCYNPRCEPYRNYGGRGIRVYGPFHDVVVFIAWIEKNLGPCPDDQSLDRINNDGHYEPGNLRWASSLVQTLNRGHGLVSAVSGPGCTAEPRCLCSSEEERLYAPGSLRVG